MTTIMQIYLTILLGLIVLTIISGVIYKIADYNDYDILYNVSIITNVISCILTFSWIIYLLLALIWHWF